VKIFITGHDGFIGQHMVQRLQGKHELEFLQHDLRDHDKVGFQLRQFNPDIIVHLAARTEVEQSFYEQITFSDINYTGTVNLIEIAKDLPNLKNFVFASTMEVYGWQPISDVVQSGKVPKVFEAFDENTLPNPNAPYAVAKFACEKYLEYANRAYDLEFSIIRQTNAYGRKDNDYFVTEQIIKQMLTGNVLNLGYSEPYRNFIFIEDLLDAWMIIIENKDKCSGKIFTIGPDEPRKIKDCVNLIAKKLNWSGEINWDTKPARFGEIYWLNSNHRLLSSVTGWSPKVSYDSGIDRTIEIWQSNLKK
jgi:UDP-glucose 4-epimerase